jgi:hypothetical protein
METIITTYINKALYFMNYNKYKDSKNMLSKSASHFFKQSGAQATRMAALTT